MDLSLCDAEEDRRAFKPKKHGDRHQTKWGQLGPEPTSAPATLGNAIMHSREVLHGTPLEAWCLDHRTSQPNYTEASLRSGKKVGSDYEAFTLRDLRGIGIGYWKVLPNDYGVLDNICRARRYRQMDEIKLHQIAKDEALLDKWYGEQLHQNEQMILCMEGSLYIDVRNKADVWVRMHLTPGDLVTIPTGIYHRLTLDEGDYAWLMCLLRDAARWLPIYRTDRKAESNPCRMKYAQAMRQGVAADETGFMPDL